MLRGTARVRHEAHRVRACLVKFNTLLLALVLGFGIWYAQTIRAELTQTIAEFDRAIHRPIVSRMP